MKIDLHELLSHNGYTLGSKKNIRKKAFRHLLAETPPERVGEVVAASNNFQNVANGLGFPRTIVRKEADDIVKYCQHFGIDCSHLEWKTRYGSGRKRVDRSLLTEEVIEEFFSANSTAQVSRTTLTRLIRDHNLLPDRCAECGISEKWNGLPLRLHIDHINGVNTDNRLENLRSLCPNCHTQTDTYGAKNKKTLSAVELALAKKV